MIVAAGSEIAGEAAAGLAAAYIVLGANKAVSATTLSSYLTHSEQLYTLATTHQGSYQTLTDDPCLKQLGVRAAKAPEIVGVVPWPTSCRAAMASCANARHDESSPLFSKAVSQCLIESRLHFVKQPSVDWS